MIYRILFLFLFMALYGCSSSIDPSQFYGKWYINAAQETDQNEKVDLLDCPSLEFLENDSLIRWNPYVKTTGTWKYESGMLQAETTLLDGRIEQSDFTVITISENDMELQVEEGVLYLSKKRNSNCRD